jgi:hypothetical protein
MLTEPMFRSPTPDHHRRGTRTVVRGIAVAGCLGLLVACSGSGSGANKGIAPLPSGVITPGPEQTYQTNPGQPAIPNHGAYVGASVEPQTFDEAGREQAVRELQTQLGRPLDLVHVYQTWDADFPASTDQFAVAQGSYLMLSWALTDTQVIASGQDDSVIRAEAVAIRQSGDPILLEPRWEMDRPNLSSVVHSPAAYIAAWRHIHSIFTSLGVHNAAWVWCPTAVGFATSRAPSYYPGDNEVDWVCADAYPGPDELSLAKVIAPFLAWAEGHHKPAMVGEFGISRAVSPAERATWLRQAAATIRANPQIRAMVYWDSGLEDSPHGNYSLAGDDIALASFRSLVRTSYFDPRAVVP